MAATNLEMTVTVPPPTPRSRGLLVDAAATLEADAFVAKSGGPSRLGLGVQFTPWGCDPLHAGNLDCTADYIIVDGGNKSKASALNGFPDTVVQPAFKVVDGLTCSTLSFPDDTFRNYSMSQRLLNRMRVLMSAMLMSELVTGAASGGSSLSSADTSLAASTTMDDVAQAVEGFLATQLHGAAGLVFIPPQILHQAVEAGWVQIEGDSLMTATGHSVVADAGYLGDPSDPAEASPSTFTVFASGPVNYRVSDTKLLGSGSETLDLDTNMRERLAEAYAQLAFDPCPVGSTVLTPA